MINGMRYVAASILLVCAVIVPTPALADRAQSAAPKLEQLSDTPHTGEDALATFQFAKGRLDGKPFVLLFEVIRDPGEHPVPSPAPTVIYVYSLTHSDGTPG